MWPVRIPLVKGPLLTTDHPHLWWIIYIRWHLMCLLTLELKANSKFMTNVQLIGSIGEGKNLITRMQAKEFESVAFSNPMNNSSRHESRFSWLFSLVCMNNAFSRPELRSYAMLLTFPEKRPEVRTLYMRLESTGKQPSNFHLPNGVLIPRWSPKIHLKFCS